MSNYREHEHRLANGTLNVAIGPDHGPPLVLLHGVTRRWQCLLPVIDALSSRWQVFAVDLPGHGRSSFHCDPYTVACYADVIHEWMRERFSSPAVVYGHSLGAMLAAEVAGRPDALVGAAILEDPPFHTMGHNIARTPLLSYFQGLLPFAGRSTDNMRAFVEDLAQVPLTDPRTGQVSLLGASRSAAALRFMASCLSRLPRGVLEPIVRSAWLDGYDLTAVADRLRVPTLLLQADATMGGMLTDADARLLTERADDVLCLRRAGVGHQMHWADPTWLTGEVTLFLESLPWRQG